MVQPVASLLSKDPTRSYRTHPAVRCRLLKSEMRSVLMMVTNILGKQSLQMAFRCAVKDTARLSIKPFLRSF
jgi:hypothetical protein